MHEAQADPLTLKLIQHGAQASNSNIRTAFPERAASRGTHSSTSLPDPISLTKAYTMPIDNLSLTVATVVVFALGYLWRSRGGRLRLPPGPHSNQSFFVVSKPIPKDPRGPWFAFDALGKQFGTLNITSGVLQRLTPLSGSICLFFLGKTPVIGTMLCNNCVEHQTQRAPVLTKAQVAWDLLEKRGEIYSSRPRQIMA